MKTLEAELAREFRAEVEEHRARQTLYLQHIMQQSMAQWERSCQDTPTPQAKDDQPPDLPDEPLPHPVPGKGDVRYFNTAIRAMIELRKIWRLDAPSPPAPASPPPTPSVPQVDRVIYEVNRLPGIYEEPEREGLSARPAPGRISPAPVPPAAIPELDPPDLRSNSNSNSNSAVPPDPPGPTPAPETPPTPPSVMHASPTADACPPGDLGSPSLVGKGPEVRSHDRELEPSDLRSNSNSNSNSIRTPQPSSSSSSSSYSSSSSDRSPSGPSTLHPLPSTPPAPRRTISGAILPAEPRI